MTTPTLYALAGIALVGLGLVHFAVRRHVVRRVLALNVTGSGVFLVLIALARRAPDGPDPVPHAMVLTGIVVAVSATAAALALAVRGRIDAERSGTRPDDAPPA